MAKEILDVIDTAVKIGLGSLITGVATYLVHRHNSNNEQKKFTLEHKIQMLELASDCMEEYFSSWAVLLSLYGGISKKLESDDEPLKKLTDSHISALRERDNAVIESWSKRAKSISRLTLIGASPIVELLESASEIQKELRIKIFFNRDLLTTAEYDEVFDQVRSIKKKIHHETALYYEALMG